MDTPAPPHATVANPPGETLVARVRHRAETNDMIRRAIILFNAGTWDRALSLFQAAQARGADGVPLARFLADCYCAIRRPAAAAAALSATDPTSVRDRLQLVSCLSESGHHRLAFSAMREAVARDPECAPYHFHLGTMLAERGDYDEAELRFTQVLSIDRDHVEAIVQLALCCGAGGRLDDAFGLLQRAQAHRPGDGRIGVMLTQCAKVLAARGVGAQFRPTLRAFDEPSTTADIDRLSRLIADDPDFIDALLSVGDTAGDEGVLPLLLATLRLALEREPEYAELHYHLGCVLARLGQPESAIAANERAIALDATLTGALIELGQLYQKTDQHDYAIARLEQAVRAGADYADVHFQLGGLYRDQGRDAKARHEFGRALRLNDGYTAAEEALETLYA